MSKESGDPALSNAIPLNLPFANAVPVSELADCFLAWRDLSAPALEQLMAQQQGWRLALLQQLSLRLWSPP